MTRRTFGWHTPDSAEGDKICRPLAIPPEFVPIVGGCLAMLTEVWNWEQVGTMTAREAAEAMAAMLVEWYSEEGECMGCCTQLRRNPDTGEIEFSNDEGETWEPITYPGEAPTAPGEIDFPPPTAQPEGSDSEQRCRGAMNAAIVLQELYGQTIQEFVEGAGNAVLSFMDLLFRFADVILGAHGALNLFGEAALDVVANSAEFVPDGFPDASLQAVADLLYCSASAADDIVTFDFDEVIADMQFQGAVEPYPGLIVLLQLYLRHEGLNRAGSVQAATTFDCSEADCTDPCETYTPTSSAVFQYTDPRMSGYTYLGIGGSGYQRLAGSWTFTDIERCYLGWQMASTGWGSCASAAATHVHITIDGRTEIFTLPACAGFSTTFTLDFPTNAERDSQIFVELYRNGVPGGELRVKDHRFRYTPE